MNHYFDRQIESVTRELNKKIRYLNELEQNWNGEDLVGVLEDRLVHWEREMGETESEIEALEHDLSMLEESAEMSDAELKVDLECQED